MFSINLSDVVAVLKSLIPELVVIGVFLVLAIIITIAVNKRTVKSVANRKMIHSQSWLVTFVAIVVALATMLLGPLSNLITKSTNKHELQPATVTAARDLAKDIQRESVTMLQNSDETLPLKDSKVNVFGWASTNPVYGGTGSGSMSPDNPTTSLLDGIKEAGLETNTELSKFYTDYREDRPKVEMFEQDWTLPEPTAAKYSDKLRYRHRGHRSRRRRGCRSSRQHEVQGPHLSRQRQVRPRFPGWTELPGAVQARKRHDRQGHRHLRQGGPGLQRRQHLRSELRRPVSADQVRPLVPAPGTGRLHRPG